MTFCTVINCLDGRVQLPVIKYLRERFKADYVDSITEAGPNLILSEGRRNRSTQSILDRLSVSVEKHKSVGIAIVCHHDCAGNPAAKDEQLKQLQMALRFLRQEYDSLEIIGLWVDESWAVSEVAAWQELG